ncbi:hypothetical protein [Paenibacillus contaminans]|uniref:Uncharacterized protein n=1 Tax=Paenibacillus contaminans TaxID=450362 RepID=A0A329MGC8_9BACL|nr:hypothetical protein [Paenibacillus contaminans]RAV18860.1 hypothetical protein DQG23_24335 [Paenibacillus contaminans]
MKQLDIFDDWGAEQSEPAPPVVSAAPKAPVLNGMYYERSTDKFVSFVLGRRHYEVPAKTCGFLKAWQEKTKRERAI